VSEGGIEIERAPEGVVFEPLEDDTLLGTLVGTDEKFAAHNAAEWKNGLLVRVPKGVELEKPLYVVSSTRWTAGRSSGGCSSVAEEGSRFSFIEEYVSRRPSCGLLERCHRALRRAGREARVRLHPEPVARDVAFRIASSAGRPRRRAGLGRGRLRLEEGQGSDRERPRGPGGDLARDGRLLRGRRPAPRLRHAAGTPRSLDDLRLRLQRARSATMRRRSGAG
jgi:hypothetical protein